MSIEIVLPAVVAVVAGVLATASHRRLRPPVGACLLVVTMTAVVIAVVPAVAVFAFGFLTHLPWFGGALTWCRDALDLHPRVPEWLGMPAVIMIGAAGVRLHRVRRSWLRFRCDESDGIEILPSDKLFAYTMPGPGGHIVVSDGLVERLDDGEVAVVLAHERVHARQRHDRYLLVGAVAVAMLPFLAPMQRRLTFALERWADEDAVTELDADRTLVARTLATVALSGAAVPPGAVGVVGLGVAGRVAALLEPAPTAQSRLWLSVGAVGVLAVLGAAAVQAHHVMPLLAALCPG